MKPFFKPEDFFVATGKHISQSMLMANFANAKLEREGVRVYGLQGHRNIGWTEKLTNLDTHTALLINIEKIEDEKPKCEMQHLHCHMVALGFNYCKDCGQKLGDA